MNMDLGRVVAQKRMNYVPCFCCSLGADDMSLSFGKEQKEFIAAVLRYVGPNIGITL